MSHCSSPRSWFIIAVEFKILRAGGMTWQVGTLVAKPESNPQDTHGEERTDVCKLSSVLTTVVCLSLWHIHAFAGTHKILKF